MSDTNTETGKSTKKPSHYAYAVIDRGEKDAKWREIGVAFPHKDGKGFDILLDVAPLNGRVTIRVPSEKK
jgi:hypothetical protein